MKLRDLKNNLLHSRCQIFVFDQNGQLLESCHGIADVSAFMGSSVFERWPVLESIRPVLGELQDLDIPFRLPAVEFALKDQHGFFDFEFYIHPEESDKFIWIMIDQTRIYRYFQRIQQQRNILLLEKEYRETGRHITISSGLEG